MLPALAEAGPGRESADPQRRHGRRQPRHLFPAGDGLPVLAALEAEVRLIGPSGRRSLTIAEFMVGVKRTALDPGELIESISLPLLDGWQGYSKVGVRNAMVIATASACLASDVPSRSIRLALGSVAPTIIRCPEAEPFAIESVDSEARSTTPDVAERFGQLAAAASRPIDDHRSSAAYRRHAVGVMAGRLLRRAFPGVGR